jgi:hypothetical protein
MGGARDLRRRAAAVDGVPEESRFRGVPTRFLGWLFLLALAPLACGHRLVYKVGDEETPRADFGTPYVLAVAEIADARRIEPGDVHEVAGSSYSHIADGRLSHLGTDMSAALRAHLAFSGLFPRVVEASPESGAHLLLTGEVRRFRIYVRPALRGKLQETRTDFDATLTLWRVDGRRPVWVRDVRMELAADRVGDLPEVTNDAFRQAMNAIVDQIAVAVRPHGSGAPHPPPFGGKR